MPDNPAPVAAHIQRGAIEWNRAFVPVSQISLPILYFDDAQSVSHLHGFIGITLTVTGNVKSGDGGIIDCAAVAAHL